MQHSKKIGTALDLLATIRLTTAFMGFKFAFSQTAISQFSRTLLFGDFSLLKFNMEMYRSGRNENDSKSACDIG